MKFDYDNDDYKNAGIDWDLIAAFEYNETEFSIDDIRKVLAVWEGENDGDNWRWIIELKNNDLYFVVGWCDYTGWDCRSDVTDYKIEKLRDFTDIEENSEVKIELLFQLIEQKTETWRESMDKEIGNVNIIDL